jgi:phenylpropionate dioxygenase-like ring-hydroxylating dioxygenase large terminal subunit
MIDDPVLLNDWHVVARASELRVGEVRPVTLLGRDLVLWRSQSGYHCWLDLCVHRGAKLSGGHMEGHCLVCPYHGWNYDGSGRCVKIPTHLTQAPPTRAQATVFPFKEEYDLLWVCLGDPRNSVPNFPEWHDPAFRKIGAGPYRFKAQGPRVIENFLDVGHFPFVHAGLLGDIGHTEIDDYEVETTADGVIAKDITVWQPDPDGTGKPAKVLYTYHAQRPLIASFVKKHNEQRFSMIDIVTPVSADESISWVILALNYAPEVSDESLRTFQDKVSAQDIPIVESQRPELLPLDLQAELHLRSDRTAIAYRRWLKQLGLRYGTS